MPNQAQTSRSLPFANEHAEPSFEKLQTRINILYSQLTQQIEESKSITYVVPLDEKLIWERVQELIKCNGFNPSNNNYSNWVRELKYRVKGTTPDTFPSPPEDMNSLNEYVQTLFAYNYGWCQGLRDPLFEIYHSLIYSPVAMKYLTVKSVNCIIAYFASIYKVNYCYQAIKGMTEAGGQQPNIGTVCVMLNMVLTSKTAVVNKQSHLLAILQYIEKYKLVPDASVLFLLYKGFEKPILQEQVLELLVKEKVNLRRIDEEIAIKKLENGEPVAAVKQFLRDNSSSKDNSRTSPGRYSKTSIC
ncbi:unnamed protein product [Ambrosiozyma monospora]|uniref:Unnamed protein product n=1 Tax=Ambrosiozyma monospora TaxID=43982 RepID=A0A9W6Z7K3_AMBMO|nr:unnamed protein product [Ambrosiozyma monospora]